MKATLGIVLIVCSPFIVGALILLGIRAQEAYQNWRYRCAVHERNARLRRHNITPFRGTKKVLHDDLY